jgi:hypothetical protein
MSGTLAECEAYANNFYSTCGVYNGGETAPDFVDMGYDSESCASNYGNCIGTVDDDGVCNWKRKLCVTCFKEDGYVMIRVQSNSAPDHCYYAATNAPVYNEIDF